MILLTVVTRVRVMREGETNVSCTEMACDTGLEPAEDTGDEPVEDTGTDTDTDTDTNSDTDDTDTGSVGECMICLLRIVKPELTAWLLRHRKRHTMSGMNACWANSVERVGCMAADMGCGAALTYAASPDNPEQCYGFTNTCTPLGGLT